VLIGILEGVAEATAGLSKGYFGARMWREESPFVQLGYTFSAISKPMMAVFIFRYGFSLLAPSTVLEGLRTGARDAMLSDEATPRTKGKIFGFHRSMDTLGCIRSVSPTLPLLLSWELYYLFYIAFIPDFCYSRYPLLKRKKNGSRRKQLPSSRFGK
jgi:hypothetical protein